MKKAFVVFCVMMMAVSSVFCGCGKKKDEGSNTETAAVDLSGSEYTGSWMATKAEFKGEEQDVNEVVEGGIFLTLNADGTASLSSEGEESTGNWSETSDGVALKGKDLDVKFKSKDGKLVYELFGVSLYLEKQ